MNNDNKSFREMVISIIALCSSIVAIFNMYYIFAAIAVILGIIGLRKESTRGMSRVTLVIVGITLVIKILNMVVANNMLPQWLSGGML